MTKIYAIAMQKGGVGKTTSVVNIGAYLTSKGFRVLVIDLDPQANATSNFGFNKHELDRSIYDLLLEQASCEEVTIEHGETKVNFSQLDRVNILQRTRRTSDQNHLVLGPGHFYA